MPRRNPLERCLGLGLVLAWLGPSGWDLSHPLAAVASGTRSRAAAGMDSC